MAALKLRIVPDPVLRAKAKKITRIDASVHKLADDMIDTMHQEGGIGLAANQVGVLRRLIVIELPEVDREGGSSGASLKDRDGGSSGASLKDREARVYINPEVVEATGQRQVEEGCLSVPGYRAHIFRSESVKVKALDRQGKPVKVKAEGLLAQALEHEIDHLNGILYMDHLKSHEDLWKLEENKDGSPQANVQPAPSLGVGVG